MSSRGIMRIVHEGFYHAIGSHHQEADLQGFLKPKN
jgi:hypothetical protein